MTKILKNKTFKCWFSILLAFLLVVTLAPSFQAFGTDEDGKTDITVQEEGSDLTVSGIPEDALETELPRSAMMFLQILPQRTGIHRPMERMAIRLLRRARMIRRTLMKASLLRQNSGRPFLAKRMNSLQP